MRAGSRGGRVSALRAEAVAGLAFPLRLGYSLCFPWGRAGRAESEQAVVCRSGHFWDPQLSLFLSLAPADSCSQGCRVCGLIFRSRLEGLSVFSLSPLLTSGRAEQPSLNLSGGGHLQESCGYWPLPQRHSDNCVQVSVRCCLSPVWEWRRATLGCHAAVYPCSRAAGDGGSAS